MSNRDTCSSCEQWKSCPTPLTCELAECEPEIEPSMSWAAVAWVCIAIVALVAAFIRSFS